MAVPKQKQTKSKTSRRRSHHALTKNQFAKCPKCGQSVLSHRVCANCGSYKGREVIDVLAKLSKKQKKDKEAALAEESKEQAKTLNMEDLSKK